MILCDARLPSPAKIRLAEFGELIEIYSDDITYDAISGHPDVFCCPVGDVLVVSPSLPSKIKDLFNLNGINWQYGLTANTFQYPQSAVYNAVVTENLLIHNLLITDSEIKKLSGNRKHIHVNQGYARCNLLPLPDDRFITSDKGIYSTLTRSGFEVLFVDPTGIILDGFPNGFIGGACGVKGDSVFIVGKLSGYKEGQKIEEFLSRHSLSLIELYDGPLFDGGSIFFI